MGTLRKLKVAMKLDHDLRKLLIKGSRNEILVDIDEDKEADIMLADITGNGNIDTLAVDLTDDGEFNLFIKDTDGNGVPDTVILYDENDEIVAMTEDKAEVEQTVKAIAEKIYLLLQAKEIIADELDKHLRELDKEVRQARRKLRAR